MAEGGFMGGIGGGQAAGGALSMVSSLGRMILGGKQRRQGWEIYENLDRPKSNIDAAITRVNLMRQLSASGVMPGYTKAVRGNEAALVQMLNATKGMGSSVDITGTASKAFAKSQKSKQDINRASAAMGVEVDRELSSAYGGLQEAQETKFGQELGQYKLDADVSSALIGAGYENISGGMKDIGGGLSQIAL